MANSKSTATKTTTTKGKSNGNATVTSTPVNTGPSKRQIAAKIFRENAALKQPAARKDIIERFMTEAHLTKSGAATYYQNFKSGAWSTEPVAKATPTAQK